MIPHAETALTPPPPFTFNGYNYTGAEQQRGVPQPAGASTAQQLHLPTPAADQLPRADQVHSYICVLCVHT